ncbi:UPF0187-domain-containing protein [Gloeophyllum trabeum ATCC 11539]|uniref:UPF0187-domain-containing protein n=1 Tax=Gloeophyllum trabeum (strain ATCC 11539 / FP-39264 / Madison 617) TaxID=670483 RepID=S7Q5M4_GLOTA|nr:UPF0187-domain-containing protein [Gloeophyllum trabeum ATCC 11539]EPQ55356.1 UPF0187-domain-containing protein [Gloeophyllum trabeum ATCC 11539]
MTSHASKRSATGQHPLLPAQGQRTTQIYIPLVPDRTFVTWTFGKDTVIWRIWPAVLLHTGFAAVVVTMSMRSSISLEVPPVLLTVLGMVIGFVISYRASSGYDRYWMGRSYWADAIRNVRTLARLIWYHVPPRMTAKTQEEIDSGVMKRGEEEMRRVMAEKRLALELLQGFVVAMKHHLRGEMGIYYEDFYHLVRPLHDHPHHRNEPKEPPEERQGPPESLHPSVHIVHRPSASSSKRRNSSSNQDVLISPVVPPINAYGTFDPAHPPYLAHRASSSASDRSEDSDNPNRPLLPGAMPREHGFVSKISGDLIPFESVFSTAVGWVRRLFGKKEKDVLPSANNETGEEGGVERKYGEPKQQSYLTHVKHRPRVAGGGENLPLELLWCLSEWFSVLEDRGTVPGTSLGAMIAYVANLEDSLTGLEKILTTPLPFVFSAHIRHTVWIYLFFLPFQLLQQFGWYTIPGVMIAAFIYLGFLAAGEEIEQPFGYDENDLDLDLFCKDIVDVEMRRLLKKPAPNVYSGSHHTGGTVVENVKKEQKQAINVFGPIDGEEY